MLWSPSRKALICGMLLLCCATAVASAATYAVTIDGGIDTPDKSVELEGSSYTVRGIASIDAGDTIEVSVDHPTGESYRVYLYGNKDGARQILLTKYRESGSTVTFDTSDYPDLFPPGTYTVALHADGKYRAVYPFVVSGATLAVDQPDAVTKGDTATIQATASPTDDRVDLTGVEFVLHGNDMSKRVSASGSGGDYSASFETADLPTGEYTIYAVANNDSVTPKGNQEIVALSTENTLTVTSDGSGTTTSTGGGGGGGGLPGGSDGGETQTTTASTTVTTTSVGSTTAPTTDETTDSTTTQQSDGTTTTGQGNVIKPGSPTQSSTSQTTSAGGPGFSIAVAMLALGCTIGLLGRLEGL